MLPPTGHENLALVLIKLVMLDFISLGISAGQGKAVLIISPIKNWPYSYHLAPNIKHLVLSQLTQFATICFGEIFILAL